MAMFPGWAGRLLGSAATLKGDAAAVGRYAVKSVASDMSTMYFNAASRSIQYTGNWLLPNVVAAPEDMIHSYYAGDLGAADLWSLLGFHGIAWDTDPGASRSRRAWASVIKNAQPHFPLESMRSWWRQGRVDGADVERALVAEGFGNPVERALFMYDRNVPDTTTILDWRDTGRINDDAARRMLRVVGWLYEPDQDKLLSQRPAPTLGDTLAMWNRGIIGPIEAQEYMRRMGYAESGMAAKLSQLGNLYPPLSDLLLFSVREVYDAGVVNRWQYDAEFPEPFGQYMAKQGYGWSDPVTVAPGAPPVSIPWPQQYWRSHWTTISPGQANELLHRVRGDPDQPGTWSVPGLRPFTPEDHAAILKIHDYPVPIRDYLRAISYAVPRLIDIRNALQLKIRGRAWAYNKFLDRGHSDDDAQFLADLAIRQQAAKDDAEDAARRKTLRNQLAAEYIEHVEQGHLDAAAATNGLKQLGWSDQAISLGLQLAYRRAQTTTLKEGIARVRSDWMKGVTNRQEASFRLGRLGVIPEMAEQWITRWINTRGEARTMMGSEWVLRHYRAGRLNREQAALRLTNLNWLGADILLSLAEADQAVITAQAKLSNDDQKRRIARDKELTEAALGLSGIGRKVQADLRRIAPVAALQRWLKAQRISLDRFRASMRARGFPDDEIAMYAAEAMPAEERADNVQ